MSNANLIAGMRSLSYITRAAFVAAQLPNRISAVQLLGYAAAGDAPPVWWKRLASAPGSPHPGQVQIADSSWWQIVPAPGNTLDPRWFGCKIDGVTDDLAAFTLTRDAAVGLGNCDILLPSGGLVLGTTGSPMSNFTLRGIFIHGQDPNRTIIFLPGNAAVSFLMDAAAGQTGGGLRRVTLWAPTGKTAGRGLMLDGDATYQPDECAFQDLKITGSGAWDIPLYISGVDRATGSPPGVRKVSILNCFLGRGTSAAMYCDNVEEFICVGLGTYGGAVAAGNDIYVTSGNGATRSSIVQMLATNCQGTLILDRAQAVDAQGNFNAINATANSLKCIGRGFCASITDAGTGNNFTGFV